MTSLCKLEKNKANKDVVKSDNSDFEVANKIIRRIYSEIRTMPSNRQIFIGASCGWISGVLALKIGRTLALALGGGLILLQIASDRGYISINWNQLSQTLKKQDDMIEKTSSEGQCQPIKAANWITEVMDFAAKNMSLTVGILGGFFIGLAS